VFGLFCIDFRAVTNRSETSQNMSFGSNVVDQLHSLRKVPTELQLENLRVNEFSVPWSRSGAFVSKNCNVRLFSKLVR
jgi:hypothetical protein